AEMSPVGVDVVTELPSACVTLAAKLLSACFSASTNPDISAFLPGAAGACAVSVPVGAVPATFTDSLRWTFTDEFAAALAITAADSKLRLSALAISLFTCGAAPDTSCASSMTSAVAAASADSTTNACGGVGISRFGDEVASPMVFSCTPSSIGAA